MENNTTTPIYKHLKVRRPVSVEPCLELDGSALPRRILVMIMGPTGAGKSAFIEALSGNNDLGIAKDQLEGFTRSVSAFQLINVITNKGPSGRYPIYLIDTPGFSDPNISQVEIVQKVEKWMRDSQFTAVTHILYFVPINDIRMPGSKRRTVGTFKSLTGLETARALTVATSMWDKLWSDQQKERAEKRFCEIRDDIWKDFTRQGSQIVKFENTQESALSIINSALSTSSTNQFFCFEDMMDKNHKIRDTPFGERVYEDLVLSISGLKLRKQSLRAELCDPEMMGNEEYREIMQRQAEETERALAKFERQLVEEFPSPLNSRSSTQEGSAIFASDMTMSPTSYGPSSRSTTLGDIMAPSTEIRPSGLHDPQFSSPKMSRSSVYLFENLDNKPRPKSWSCKFAVNLRILCRKALLRHKRTSSI